MQTGPMSHRLIKLMHIPKGFANYLLNGSTPTQSAKTGEFGIEQGYAMPENLFSQFSKTSKARTMISFLKAM